MAGTPQRACEERLWKAAAGRSHSDHHTSSPRPGDGFCGPQAFLAIPQSSGTKAGAPLLRRCRFYRLRRRPKPRFLGGRLRHPTRRHFVSTSPCPANTPTPAEAAERLCKPAARTALYEVAEAPTRERSRLPHPPGSPLTAPGPALEVPLPPGAAPHLPATLGSPPRPPGQGPALALSYRRRGVARRGRAVRWHPRPPSPQNPAALGGDRGARTRDPPASAPAPNYRGPAGRANHRPPREPPRGGRRRL